jgi:hypothetical protein
MKNLFTNQKQIERAIRAAVEQYNKWRKNEDLKRNRRSSKKVSRYKREKI